MKRTGIRRGDSQPKRTPMKQSRKRLPARNNKRHAREWEKAYHSEAFVQFTRTCPSSATGERGPCVVSHSARSRGAGGTYRHALPLTPAEHAYEHTVGVETAWKQWGKDPRVEAEEHWQRFQAFQEVWGT